MLYIYFHWNKMTCTTHGAKNKKIKKLWVIVYLAKHLFEGLHVEGGVVVFGSDGLNHLSGLLSPRWRGSTIITHTQNVHFLPLTCLHSLLHSPTCTVFLNFSFEPTAKGLICSYVNLFGDCLCNWLALLSPAFFVFLFFSFNCKNTSTTQRMVVEASFLSLQVQKKKI